jgi:Flp pilus assembly pilin Flp
MKGPFFERTYLPFFRRYFLKSRQPDNQNLDFCDKKSKGQALVEYLLALGFAIAIAASMGPTLKTAIKSVWQFMVTNIAPPCPACILDVSIQL